MKPKLPQKPIQVNMISSERFGVSVIGTVERSTLWITRAKENGQQTYACRQGQKPPPFPTQSTSWDEDDEDDKDEDQDKENNSRDDATHGPESTIDRGVENDEERSSLLEQATNAPALPALQRYPEDGYLVLFNAFSRLLGVGELPMTNCPNPRAVPTAKAALKFNWPFIAFDTFDREDVKIMLESVDLTAGRVRKAFFDVTSRYYKVDFDFYSTFTEYATVIAFNLLFEVTSVGRKLGGNAPKVNISLEKDTFVILRALFKLVLKCSVEDWVRRFLREKEGSWDDLVVLEKHAIDGRFPWDDMDKEVRAERIEVLRVREAATYQHIDRAELIGMNDKFDEEWELISNEGDLL